MEFRRNKSMRALKIGLAGLLGIAIYAAVLQRPVATAMISKAAGGDQPCPWPALLRYPWAVQDFAATQQEVESQLTVEREDPILPIQLIRTKGRSFWIKKAGSDREGKSTLAYVLAEQEWISRYAGKDTVQPGNVVVDVGAHIGTFDDDALRRGASKLILIEPDPLNVECIRRNFPKEIAEGRVIIVPEGAWSSRSTLEFSTGVSNSGTGSFVRHENGSQTMSVPVRPLDEILADLGIAKIDYIKMDIEGAEREALKGAYKTLRGSKPVLMMDHYHLPDDAIVLPRVILEGNPQYQASCNLCSPDMLGGTNRLIPYAVFYR
jgi:FkbM family methyltransferase